MEAWKGVWLLDLALENNPVKGAVLSLLAFFGRVMEKIKGARLYPAKAAPYTREQKGASMKKFLILAAVLVVAGGVAVYMNLGGYVKKLIEQAGSAAVGTRVTVGGLDISLPEKAAKMGYLSIDNPKGFAGGLLKARHIGIKVGEVTQAVVTLEEVDVEGLQMTYALGKGGTNFDAVKKNLRSADKSSSATPAAPKLIIKKLRIRNAELVPAIEGLGNQPVTMPDIVLTNVGTRSKPATAAEAAGQILNKLLSAGTSAALKNKLTAPVTDAVGKATKGLKGLLGQ